MSDSEAAHALAEEKLAVLREVLGVTQQALLLVDLDALDPLLQRKNSLIREIQLIDEALAPHQPLALDAPLDEEMTSVVQAVLENESTLELRIRQEQIRLRRELREIDRETRLKQYLERSRATGGTVNLKK